MKNKLLISFMFLAVLPILTFGQNKLSYGINLGAEWSVMIITKSNFPPIGAISEKGSVGLGYSLGLHLQYELTKMYFIRTGAHYQQLKHVHKTENLVFAQDLIDGTTSTLKNSIYISSIGIPLEVGYTFASNDVASYYFGLEAVANVLLSNNSIGKLQNQNNKKGEDILVTNTINPSIVSGGLFFGRDYKLNTKLIFGIEYNIRYTPNNFIIGFGSEAITAIETGITLRLRMF